MLTGSIAGVLFTDSNGNGIQDGNEGIRSGVRVFLDLNGDGARQAAEPLSSTNAQGTTDALGNFAFNSLAPNKYLVALDVPASSRVSSQPESSIAFKDISTAAFSGVGTPLSVVSLDIDQKDGPDLVAVVGTQLFLLKNNGKGSFTQSSIALPNGIQAGNLVVGNFDAGTADDKGMDLAMAASNQQNGQSKVLVFRNTGGQLSLKNTLVVASQPIMLAAGQLDGEAGDELVVTRQNGLDVFLSPATVANPEKSSVSGLVGYVEDAEIGDFDGVNGNDIAFVINDTLRNGDQLGRVGIVANNGAGSFPDAPTFSELDGLVTSVTCANLDNVGGPELIVTSYSTSDGSDGKLWILNGDLNSVAHDEIGNPVQFLFGGTGAAVVESRDMDGDGFADILIQNGSSKTDTGIQKQQISLYRNQFFQDQFLNFELVGDQGGAPLSFAPARGFAVADVDQRGGPDWILVDAVARKLTIRCNQQTAAQVTVFDNDVASPTIGVKLPTILSIAAEAANKPEGGAGSSTHFTFKITRTGEKAGSSSVHYSVAGSGTNPADSADFIEASLSGDVNFEADQTELTITVDVQGDNIGELDETFEVTLSNAVNSIISPAKATGTIKNDDPTLSLMAVNAERSEGQSGTTAFTFKVSRISTTGTRSVSYSVIGSGTNPADAQDFGTRLPSGTVTIPNGKADATITVNVKGDTKSEDNEQFTVKFTPLDETATAIGTIRNDDAELAISPLSISMNEGSSSTTATEFKFIVTRTGDLSIAATAKFTVTGTGVQKALASDFFDGRLPSESVTFAPGCSSASITIKIKGDATNESNEGFVVTLSNSSVGTTIKVGQAFGTILNDD